MTERTAPIKFTAATVREVAARVKKITDGYFALETTGSDLGNGTRYFDAHQMQVWFGPEGARQACAYYIGGALETVRLTHAAGGDELSVDDESYLHQVQAAYMEGPHRRKEDLMHWEERGAERARLHSESNA